MADTDTRETEVVDPAQAEADAKAKEESGRRASRPRIKEAVVEVLEELGVIGNGDALDKKDDDEPDKKDDEPAGPREQEARAEQGVAEALRSVLKEHDHDKEHEALKAEKIVEEPPKQVSRLTRLLWGDEKS